MRSDADIKEKIVELLELEGDDKARQLDLLEKVDVAALKTRLVEHHSTRGMIAALYWVLGYDFKNIIDDFVEPSVELLHK